MGKNSNRQKKVNNSPIGGHVHMSVTKLSMVREYPSGDQSSHAFAVRMTNAISAREYKSSGQITHRKSVALGSPIKYAQPCKDSSNGSDIVVSFCLRTIWFLS